jgi:hypothetical protein
MTLEEIEAKVADTMAGWDELSQESLQKSLRDVGLQLMGQGCSDEEILAALAFMREQNANERKKMEDGFRAYLLSGCREQTLQ